MIAPTHVVRSDRNSVIWLGSEIPPALVGACCGPSLEVVSCDVGEFAEQAPAARAVFIELPLGYEDGIERHREVVGLALQHGLVVSLMLRGEDSGPPQFPDRQTLELYFEQISLLRSEPHRVQAHYRDWNRALMWTANRDPGPAENRNLAIDGDSPSDNESRLLLRRAFNDMEAITLEEMHGGLSNATVWQVVPGDGARRRRPFIAKIQDLNRTLTERSNAAILREVIPSRCIAPVFQARCVDGETLGLTVYELVDAASSFVEAARTKPEIVLTSLFEETLGDCRRTSVPVHGSLSKALDDGNPRVLRWDDSLAEAASCAQATLGVETTVAEVKNQLLGLPALEYFKSTVHGDLHWGNLFVSGASCDVIVIDCARAAFAAPIVVDAACLEVSLSFPVESDRGPEASWRDVEGRAEWLEHAYDYPLPSGQLRDLPSGAQWISRGIREIRDRAARGGSSPAAYAIGVAAHLLRFASYQGDLSRRAEAFMFAARLIAALSSHLGTQSDSNS